MTERCLSRQHLRTGHQRPRIPRSSLDVFEARGGKLPRRRPAPRVTEIHAGSTIDGNGWKITVGHAQHAQPYLECLALRLETKEGTLCYSGDSGGISNELIEFARGSDMLIVMNHYFSGTEPSAAYRGATGNHRDNALIAKRAGVKTLVLTHLTAQIDLPGIREQIVHEIQQVFDGKVIWGEDLMRLGITGAKVSTIGKSRGLIMELLQLDTFSPSLKRAVSARGRAHGRTQPAISQSIKSSGRTRVPLFDRDLHDVSLTEAARRCGSPAASSRHATMPRDAGSLKHVSTGTLNIASHESAAIYLLPAALRHYLSAFPDIKVGIYRSRLAEIPKQVLDREMHVGFVKDQPAFKELTCVPVHSDEMVLVASPNHPFVRRQDVTIKDLEGQPFILHRMCRTTEQKIFGCSKSTIRCRIVAEVPSRTSRAGRGCRDGDRAERHRAAEIAAGTIVRVSCRSCGFRARPTHDLSRAGAASRLARNVNIVRLQLAAMSGQWCGRSGAALTHL